MYYVQVCIFFKFSEFHCPNLRVHVIDSYGIHISVSPIFMHIEHMIWTSNTAGRIEVYIYIYEIGE